MAKHRDERDPHRVLAKDLRFGDCIADNYGDYSRQGFVIESRPNQWVDVISVPRRGKDTADRHTKSVEGFVALETCTKKTLEAVVRKMKEEHDEALADVLRWEARRVALDRLLEDGPPKYPRKRWKHR